MKKDIFIDNNVAVNFTNPPTEAYKQLIEWLKKFENSDDDAYLVLSQQILKEYTASLGGCKKDNNMLFIIDKLTKEDRLNRFNNKQIQEFQNKYIPTKIHKKLNCNHEDRLHIPVILMSDRKVALIRDINFLNDIINFKGFTVHATTDPATLNYK